VRIDRGNINESVWVEDHELPVMELNDPLVSQIAQYPVDVNAGETGGIADMLLRQRQLHLSGEREIAAILDALSGRFVSPGPSGAPTRGRADCLPTGRNFYSVDVRAVPTPSAWELGRRSADFLAERYFQDEGEWPRAMALTVWGTSNMRTGGDDIAQALALIGARPVWEGTSAELAAAPDVQHRYLGI